LLRLLFEVEDGDSRVLRNVDQEVTRKKKAASKASLNNGAK
jgi:hypothetical protein